MQLLNTKFHIPQFIDPKDSVARKRLIKQLDNVFEKSIALIQAPAGFGKTTLLSQWILKNRLADRVCWFSIDKADNHPLRFWSYVIETLNKTHPGCCKTAGRQLQAAQEDDIQDILISMMNDIESTDRPLILVLDDYHLIDNPMIHNQFNFFLDHPINTLLIIISTRKKPNLELSRMRVSGRLFELKASALKFSEKEMVEFFSLFSNKNILLQQKKDLYKKTEGWVAAIKLAVLSINSKHRFISKIQKTQFIHDYLMEEVFEGLPEKIKYFLLKISIADRFNLSLCKKITQDSESLSHLQYIEQHRLFLIPLDDSDLWYRFHHLFLDFLRSLVPQTPHISIETHHIHAFEWFRNHHYFEDAFSHALKAKKKGLAAAVLSDHISILYGEGGEQPILPFFRRLNKKTILADPVLAGYYLGFQIYSGDFESLKKMRHLMDNSFNKKNQQLFKGFYLAFAAYQIFYVTGDLQKTIILCRDARRHLSKTHGSIHRMLEYMQTLSYRFSGQIQPAMALCKPRETDDLLMATLTATNRADLDLEMGHLGHAKQVVEHQMHEIESVFVTRMPPSIFGFLYVIMGKILKEKHKLKQAHKNFSKGLKIIKNTGFIELIVISYGEYSSLLTSCNEYNLAHKAIDTAIQIARQSFSWVEYLLVAQKNKIWIKENKLDLVEPWASRYPVHKNMNIPFIQSLEHLILAQYFIKNTKFDHALFILDAMIKKDLEDQRNGRLLECYVLKSKTLVKMGDLNRAVQLLKKAFELSRNEGHVMVYVNDSKGMEAVYKTLDQQNILPSYLSPHFEFLLPSEKKKVSKTICIHDYVEELNTRELDLLKLFSQGLSNKEAADKLCLSVNTVRWYASRIFSKLDVKRRGQAVSRAVEFNLI